MFKYEYNAIVKKIKYVNDYTATFTIEYKDEKAVYPDFVPGKYAILALPDDKGSWIPRAYSIASAPSKKGLEFYIIRVKDGALTPKIFNLKEGDEIHLGEKRVGHMTLNGIESGSNLILISTGTGIAPYISIVREYYAYNKEKLVKSDNKPIFNTISIFHGVPFTDNLGYKDELLKLEAKESNFYYFPIVSREEYNGKKGRVLDLIKDKTYEKITDVKIERGNTHVLLCGNPRMINDGIVFFENMGFSLSKPLNPGNIHIEKYF